MNTRYYIVSFANSERYRYVCEGEGCRNPRPVEKLEEELQDYLHARFPTVDTLAYYTTPEVEEVPESRREEALSLPPLDAEAVEAIKKVLVREVQNQEFQRDLDSNAPWTDV